MNSEDLLRRPLPEWLMLLTGIIGLLVLIAILGAAFESGLGTVIPPLAIACIAAWLACAGFSGYLTHVKGYLMWAWVGLGLLFGPIALLAAIGLPNRPHQPPPSSDLCPPPSDL